MNAPKPIATAATPLRALAGSVGLARIRPVDLRRFPALAARFKPIDAMWQARRPRGFLPNAADLVLADPQFQDARLVHGRFLGEDPISFHIDHFGGALHSLHASPRMHGRTIGELHAGPYLDLIARDYHDIRKLAVPRFREVYAEVPRPGDEPLLLHYIGGVWPLSEDGKTVTGLMLVSAAIG